MSFIVAADTGGTFTDLAAFDRERGQIIYAKSLTTHNDLVEGVMDCIRKVDINLAEAAVVKFGTTLVINTFVERTGAKTALLTTEGFRDTLEIGRERKYGLYDIAIRKPKPLVPRDLRMEASERVDADGRVLRQTLPGGEQLDYRYDDAGRLTRVASSASSSTSIASTSACKGSTRSSSHASHTGLRKRSS